MRPLVALGLVGVLLVACAAFDGPATAPAPGTCGGHLDCGGGGCCDEAQDGATDWVCGSAGFGGCPAGSCCFVGDPGGLAPDPSNYGAARADAGAPARVRRLRPRS